MDRLDMAKLFAERHVKMEETQTTTVITARATSDSTDGTVYVDFGGMTISGNDCQSVPIPTTVSVKSGDVVRVELLGPDGRAKTPTVTGVIGGGDRAQKAVEQASGDASEAKSTAQIAKASAETAQTSAGRAKATAEQASRTATDAKSTAAQAKSLADNLQTLIRQTSDGLTVGKSVDGKTYAGSYVLVGSDGTVKIMSKTGEAAASFEKDMVAFGASTAGQKVRFCGGKGELSYRDGQIWLSGKSVMLVPHDPTGPLGGDQYLGYDPQGNLTIQCHGQYHVGDAFFTSEDFAKVKAAISADYITSQSLEASIMGRWSWRRWASGLFEIWGIFTAESSSGWSRVGGTDWWKWSSSYALPEGLTALEDVQLTTDWDGYITSDSENGSLDNLNRLHYSLFQRGGSDGLDKSHSVRAYIRGRFQ